MRLEMPGIAAKFLPCLFALGPFDHVGWFYHGVKFTIQPSRRGWSLPLCCTFEAKEFELGIANKWFGQVDNEAVGG
jgi:hypothetical protein